MILKKISPCLRVLADYKIMDGGYALAEIAYKAGADIVTVSAQTWDETILQTIQAARDCGWQPCQGRRPSKSFRHRWLPE